MIRYRLPEGNDNPYSTEPLDELVILDITGLDEGLGVVDIEIALHESDVDVLAGKEPIIHGFITVVNVSTAEEAISAILADGQVVKKRDTDPITVNLSGAIQR